MPSRRRSRINPGILFLGAGVLVLVAGLALIAYLRSPPPAGELIPIGSLPPTPPHGRVLLAVGDIGSCDGQADEAVAELATALPGVIALLGDIAYPRGTAQDFAACFDPAWGTVKDRLRPVPGNHEYETDDAAGYFSYFGDGAGEVGDGWYSYDHGSWHVIALNSNCDPAGGCRRDSAQFAWLQADLRNRTAECTLAYWHHPRYSTGRHGNTAAMDDIWQALADAGVDLVLSSHDHSYERLLIGDVRAFVVGTGGRSLYRFPRPPSSETEVRNDATYGLLWLALGPGSYDWQFLAVSSGGFTDAGTGECQ